MKDMAIQPKERGLWSCSLAFGVGPNERGRLIAAASLAPPYERCGAQVPSARRFF